MLYRRLVESHLEEDVQIVSIRGKGLTYLQIDNYVKGKLCQLESEGVRKGDRILISGQGSWNTVITILACIAGGFVFVPIDERMPMEKIRMAVLNCSPRAVTGISEELSGLPVLKDTTGIDEECRAKTDRDRAVVGLDETAYILYTSGSTGAQKGVLARHRQVMFCTEAINKRLRNGRDDCILSILPLAFDYGLYQLFLALDSGARLFIADNTLIQRIPYLLKKYSITGFPATPSLLRMLLTTGLLERMEALRLRYITSTGEYFPVEMVEALEQAFPDTAIVPMYGLTECKRVSIMPLDSRIQKAKRGSCGTPLEGVDVWLRDKDANTGIGELVVCGPNVMDGYWNEIEETSRYFGYDEERKGAVLYTGDLFRIDMDGFLYFVERKKRILKIRGYRLGCVELEQLVSKIDGVREACVFMIRGRDNEELAGICAVSTQPDIACRIRETVEEYCHVLKGFPLWVVCWPLPRSRNQKIDICQVKRRLYLDDQ